MSFFKISAKWNQQNLGTAINVFHFEENSGTPTDASLLARAAEYLEDVYNPLVSGMDTGCVFMSGQLSQVAANGETIRIVGSITPTFNAQLGGDQLALTSAASIMARTGDPKARGSKRMPGISEAMQSDGLFSNALLAKLALSALAYVIDGGNILTWISYQGVLSTVSQTFKRFSGTAVITNVPGTQVTRKPLRGS